MNRHYLTNASRILGVLLMPFSLTMLPPIFVALWYQENTIFAFSSATLATLSLGILLWFPFRNAPRDIQTREAFLIVALLWVALSLTGAFPFCLSENPHIPYIDAVFETISGLTTTGSTVLTQLETIPRSILYYRQQLQFVGGGGIIVLSIAILPILGIGGMQLFRAEIASPFKEDKLTPRITQTAKTLWFIYIGLVILCALSYWAAGMTLFDAIGHSFSTISTGGFGTHDDNFGYFDNPLLQYLCAFFMLAGAINFSLHFVAIRRKSLSHYWQDLESKAFLTLLFCVFLFVSLIFFYHHISPEPFSTLTQSLFSVTSFLTTTGFSHPSYSNWPMVVSFLLILLSLIGGCAGSTAGGIKIIRFLILKKQGSREIKRLIHPNGHYVIKLGFSRLQDRTLEAILGFFCIFIATFMILFLVLLALDIEPVTAFSAVAASISNTGLRIGALPDNFQTFDNSVKIIISIAMLAGRLELFTLLVLLIPNYWRY